MALREYHRKRDFDESPEPRGRAKLPSARLKFVVQKHAATNLHYDFRLEHDGVLKSWAVPKGPSVDPRTKSLAVEVEDHPLDYAGFEGSIPKGQYGGGTVMVWDRGYWSPRGDPGAGLRAGKLKFDLFGEKLRGQWSLIRMAERSGGDKKLWLLMKMRDSAARPGRKDAFLRRHARSVISARDMEEIAADGERKEIGASRRRSTRVLGRARKPSTPARRKTIGVNVVVRPRASRVGSRVGALPRVFKPQLAVLSDQPPTAGDWLHEIKFDGYRMLSFAEKGKVRLVTRNGQDWTHRFPAIAAAVAAMRLGSTILDGEIVALDDAGRPNFQQLQNMLKRGDDKSLVYYIFDAPFLLGRDLTRLPLTDRKDALVKAVFPGFEKRRSPNSGILRYSDHIRGRGAEVIDKACRGSLEGIISKRADSAYQQFRSSTWLKTKCSRRQELVIAGFMAPERSRAGFGSLILGYYQAGNLKYAGRVGTGFTRETLRALTGELRKLAIKKTPFVELPREARAARIHWVRPKLVAEIEFTEWTNAGVLRHPSFKGLREDKTAREIVRDGGPSTSRQTPPKRTRSSSQGDSSSPIHEVAGVRITHPSRVLYPDCGVTKLDLARYYEKVSKWVLPHVINRPLTLLRCPEGIQGERFYQKHWTEAMPEAVRSVRVDEKHEARNYICIQDLAGLISLVQIGTLELHAWPATVEDLSHPDRLVFDLDPGEGVGWSAIARGAREIRDRLADLGLRSFLRLSGGKGIHVVAPLRGRVSWERLKTFARLLAEDMARRGPRRYTANMSKARRRGKLLIDYLRNQRGATCCASYSTRARSGAVIATPAAWEEIAPGSKARSYSIDRLPRHMESRARDPWHEFFEVRQSLTDEMLEIR